jgi:hypothetical protein
MVLEASMLPLHHRLAELEPRAGLEPTPPEYKTGVLPVKLAGLIKVAA